MLVQGDAKPKLWSAYGVLAGAPTASALFAALTSAPAASLGSCANVDPIVMLQFAGDSPLSVPVVSIGCANSTYALVGGVVRRLQPELGDGLFGAAENVVDPEARVPDLTGLAPAAAAQAASRAALPLLEVGTAVVDSLPVGSVLTQEPLPGHLSLPGLMPTDIEVVIVVHHAPPCAFAQFAFSYSAGGAGFGNDFGAVRVRNTGARWCELRGPLGLVGRGPDGSPVTQSLTYRVMPDLVLSPDARPVAPGHTIPVGVVTGVIQIGAEYRDDPRSADGICTAGRVVPTYWSVSVGGGVAAVPNHDADVGAPQSQALITCRGQLDTPSPVAFG